MAGRKLRERRKRAIFNIRSFASCLLCALVYLSSYSDAAQADDTDFARYYRAAEFCSGHVKRPLGLDLDQRVLCFDGLLTPDVDISLAEGLMPNGLFVIRSPGGDISVAAALADILQDRNATVVVYDYCFSACASYLLLASREAFVLRNTLVAWHYTVDPRWCPSLVATKDGGPERLEKSPCPDAPSGVRNGDKGRRDMNVGFYSGRAIDPLFDDPPESFTIRKILTGMFQETGKYPDVMWTWNPRYYANALRTKVTYEAYPQSQDEVDAMVARLHTDRVIYDP
ncbi:hypothetical protein [Bradyrhizobium sp.]|uniref:hypothetical protein n=1 Tax=Bradyrhizobium sp. TaxID=376 RepID=UPI00261C270A|nr:hypothetical protein [Bradyrhizobium sp.]